MTHRNARYYLFDQKKLQYERPHLLVVSDCNDFTLSGSLTMLDAPFFNVALNNVQRGEITGLNITSTWYGRAACGFLLPLSSSISFPLYIYIYIYTSLLIFNLGFFGLMFVSKVQRSEDRQVDGAAQH